MGFVVSKRDILQFSNLESLFSLSSVSIVHLLYPSHLVCLLFCLEVCFFCIFHSIKELLRTMHCITIVLLSKLFSLTFGLIAPIWFSECKQTSIRGSFCRKPHVQQNSGSWVMAQKGVKMAQIQTLFNFSPKGA